MIRPPTQWDRGPLRKSLGKLVLAEELEMEEGDGCAERSEEVSQTVGSCQLSILNTAGHACSLLKSSFPERENGMPLKGEVSQVSWDSSAD